ncbi:MAG: hypothetical protein K8F91_07590, partial [Candidatus Obscuribacterales bacterium]|nr:hypothetical protein [Candidatus Obscuribacterales bacterium]
MCAIVFLAGMQAEARSARELRVGAVTHELIKKEVDFERFYLKYKLIGTKDPRWRRARYFLIEQAATAAGIGANTIPMVETARHIKSPEDTKDSVFNKSFQVGSVAAWLGGGGSAIELCSNIFTAVKNKLKHIDPGSKKKEALRRVREIDALLD